MSAFLPIRPGPGGIFSAAAAALLAAASLCPGQQPPAGPAAEPSGAGLPAGFEAALAAYNAGNLAEARSRLVAVLPASRQSFPVHELLGLVDAAQSRPQEAARELALAARLNPASGPAHANLAAALARLGETGAAEAELRRAMRLEPASPQLERNLARLYLADGRVAEAVPLLEAAHRREPASYDTGYNLALACYLTGRVEEARSLTGELLRAQDRAELHNLMGRIDESQDRPVEAAGQFAAAAHMDPSEENLFAWGGELLLHRAYEPAIQVFEEGTRRHPESPRLWIGLGLARFAVGRYPESVEALLTAADRDPHDARCYLFLSKAYLMAPGSAEPAIARFRRYAELEPGNGRAQLYYAEALRQGRRADPSRREAGEAEARLKRAIALDPGLAEAHLQLGIVYAEARRWDRALAEYSRAARLDPGLADAHYRLGQYYAHAGEAKQAREQFALFQQIQSRRMAEADRQRAAVRQFIVSSQAPAPAASTPAAAARDGGPPGSPSGGAPGPPSGGAGDETGAATASPPAH